nr:MAG TPA: hypothetical protein [Bacteriophage sp.]
MTNGNQNKANNMQKERAHKINSGDNTEVCNKK